MISFAQSKGEDIEDVSLKPGAKISKSGSSASIGYCVKRNNVVGIVTAAHFASSGDSGGVVYSYISSTGARLTLGIHKGRHDGYAHFIKANEINSALSTTRY
ncbi:hypothetical protein [Tissierella sp.]|uniref:hypothetical protein n=1 Tax=Tissierella sp. TaxID=41274 RepID=UPI0028AF52EE|nr:hypothetical protein [Tissierella sp.]